MEITNYDLNWYWFKGNEVQSSLLQDVCLFRSYVLFDSGFRKNFGQAGKNFGDIQYSDFESYHIIACYKDQLVGTVRVTPPFTETVAHSVLGTDDYKQLIQHVGAELSSVIEINRLMVDSRVRKLQLGRTLMYAAIGLIENIWDRSQMTIIGSAGNVTKQAEFFQKHTDYEKIPDVPKKFALAFNDEITFLKYKNPPYVKGAEWIEFFKGKLSENARPKFDRLKMGYTQQDLLNLA
jgi:predicted GNAT family N-acyltransferase